MRMCLALLVCTLLPALAAGQDAAGQDAAGQDAAGQDAAGQDLDRTYALEHVRGGVYRFVAGHYRGLVVVTERSVIAVDPVDREAAAWLKATLRSRFDRPLRYLVYSHDHPDHTYGGDVLADPATTVVSHRFARDSLQRTQAETRWPDVVFDDTLTLHDGAHRIELRYHGPNNGAGSVSVRVLPERVLFVVDWIVLGRLPYRDLIGYDIDGMLRSTREVLALDFERFVGGHGDMGRKRDVRNALAYLQALHDGVLRGMLAGQSLQTLQRELRLARFSHLKQFDAWRALNIAGVYRMLRDDSYLLMRPPPAAQAPGGAAPATR